MDPQTIEIDLLVAPQPGVALSAVELQLLFSAWNSAIYQHAATDVFLHFASNLPTLSKDTLLTDFVEITTAEMHGYAAIDMGAAPSAILDTDGNWCSLQLVDIIQTSPVGTGVTALSWFLTDSTSAILLAAGTLITPIPISLVGQAISVVFKPKLKAL